jgi:DNA-directed RNA polymerase subunit M/transcription elongation factor TFIIS
MAIAFCPACDRLVYINKRDAEECPVCSGPLEETEETIRKRVIYLESSPADTVIVADLPTQKSENADHNEEMKEGKS